MQDDNRGISDAAWHKIAGTGNAYDYIPDLISGHIPGPYQADEKDPMVWVKLFTPDSSWTWYLTECDPEEDLAFALVVGFETEWGYVSLAELRSVRGPLGLRIERDLWFRPCPVSQLPAYEAAFGFKRSPAIGLPDSSFRP